MSLMGNVLHECMLVFCSSLAGLLQTLQQIAAELICTNIHWEHKELLPKIPHALSIYLYMPRELLGQREVGL